jgi:hypothetical protein
VSRLAVLVLVGLVLDRSAQAGGVILYRRWVAFDGNLPASRR